MIAQRIQEISLRKEFIGRFFHVQIEVAQNHVLTRRNDRLTILRTQNVVGTEHQDFRFGAGFFGQRTQNVEGVIGLGAAIDYINSIGIENIEKAEKEVVTYARQELSKLDYLTLYMTPHNDKHSSVISFNIKGIHPHDIASILDTEGVCVRSGNHCAQPLMRFLGIDSTCRASFSFYNDKEDVDKLIKALNKAYNMFKKYIID